MTYNNNAFFNAAFNGFLHGVLFGRKITSATAGTYSGIKAAAAVFAAAVDTNIPADGTITSAAAIVAPTTATIQGQELSKTGLVFAICSAAMAGAWNEDTTSADYSTIGAACAAVYNTAASSLVNP